MSASFSCNVFLSLFGTRLLGDSFYRAACCASTAGNALISIDLVLTGTLGNSVYRAACCARAAGNALIRNFVSHFCTPPLNFDLKDLFDLLCYYNMKNPTLQHIFLIYAPQTVIYFQAYFYSVFCHLFGVYLAF